MCTLHCKHLLVSIKIIINHSVHSCCQNNLCSRSLCVTAVRSARQPHCNYKDKDTQKTFIHRALLYSTNSSQTLIMIIMWSVIIYKYLGVKTHDGACPPEGRDLLACPYLLAWKLASSFPWKRVKLSEFWLLTLAHLTWHNKICFQDRSIQSLLFDNHKSPAALQRFWDPSMAKSPAAASARPQTSIIVVSVMAAYASSVSIVSIATVPRNLRVTICSNWFV